MVATTRERLQQHAARKQVATIVSQTVVYYQLTGAIAGGRIDQAVATAGPG
jgi:hypothetical protein